MPLASSSDPVRFKNMFVAAVAELQNAATGFTREEMLQRVAALVNAGGPFVILMAAAVHRQGIHEQAVSQDMTAPAPDPAFQSEAAHQFT